MVTWGGHSKAQIAKGPLAKKRNRAPRQTKIIISGCSKQCKKQMNRRTTALYSLLFYPSLLPSSLLVLGVAWIVMNIPAPVEAFLSLQCYNGCCYASYKPTYLCCMFCDWANHVLVSIHVNELNFNWNKRLSGIMKFCVKENKKANLEEYRACPRELDTSDMKDFVVSYRKSFEFTTFVFS